MKAQREGINALAKPSVRAVLNAWRPALGGSIFADAPNAVISAAVIVLQISMRRNIVRPQLTQLSPVSSQESGGSTIIVQVNFLQARLSPLLIRVR